MVELNVMEKEIESLLRKMEDEQGIYHLEPAEIQKIENKQELLIFLRDPKDKHVVWKFDAKVEYDVHRQGSIQDFYDDIEDFVNIKFNGKWYPYD